MEGRSGHVYETLYSNPHMKKYMILKEPPSHVKSVIGVYSSVGGYLQGLGTRGLLVVVREKKVGVCFRVSNKSLLAPEVDI